MHEWYAAPMEGLTGWRWRQVQHEMFGGAALYVTPFVSPNGNFSFQRKELEELDPERNRGIPVVPQILTNRAEYFVWAAKECRSRGWEQVDLNLGCPSGTVTGKKKGAGLLRQPELLRQLLDGIFDALPDMKISVKTRIGWERAEEWPALLALLETYPICRLTVHPRVRTQFYKGTADREVFRWTAEHTALPLCYNGDVTTVRDLREMGETFPDDAVMVGRGLVADPSLLRQATGGPVRRTSSPARCSAARCGPGICVRGSARDIPASRAPRRRPRPRRSARTAPKEGPSSLRRFRRGRRRSPTTVRYVRRQALRRLLPTPRAPPPRRLPASPTPWP